MVRLGFNLHPAFRGTGGRVVYVSRDLRHICIKLPLNWRTKNVVGSLYGGSLFSITDGAHPMMLMAALGEDYVVWDKSASIRYRKPGRSTLTADFLLTDEDLENIHAALRVKPELEHTFQIELKDDSGEVYVVVDRTVYIAERAFYNRKIHQESDHEP
jgi:acyl-coenzyme A thioesterase PaaI-like protein